MAYHLTKRGEPKVCRARPGRCPLGNLNEHYETPAQATRAFERHMRDETIPENISRRKLSAQRRERRETFQRQLQALKKAKIPGSRNWGQLQEFHLGLRSLLNDLDDLDVRAVIIAGRRFERRDGVIWANDERIVIEPAHLDELNEGLATMNQGQVHDALSSISLALGFDGDIPVAGSSEKIDLIIECEDITLRASAKSFTGSNPSLQDPSKNSYAAFRTHIDEHQIALVQAIVKNEALTDAQKSRVLREMGIRFSVQNAGLSPAFREHLSAACGDEAPRAYAEMLHSRLTGHETIANPEARNRILGMYASRMTNTTIQREETNQANAMVEIHRDGSINIFTSEEPEQLGAHLSSRIRIDSSSAHAYEWVLRNNELRVKVYSSFRIKPR